jgi:hypothetical protein
MLRILVSYWQGKGPGAKALDFRASWYYALPSYNTPKGRRNVPVAHCIVVSPQAKLHKVQRNSRNPLRGLRELRKNRA